MVQASVKLQNTSHGASEKFSISFIQATLGMARIHMNFGAYDLAKELILQVFQLCSSDQSSARKGDLFVPISASNPIRADCLIAQADLAYAYGDIVNFQDFCREAHTLLVRQLGENHVRTASALLKLGTVHMVKSEFHQSGDLIDRAYGLLTFHFGSSPKHPKVSLALHLKALLYLKLDKVQEAKDHALEALSARQALYVNHDMHPQVAESLFLAAEIYMALMDTSNAILYYESALDLRRHVYASCPEHPSICEGLLGLSIVAISKGFYIDAVKQLEECMAMRERQLQTIGVSNHIDMIPYLHWYARVLLTMGRWKEAELVVGTCGACVVANLGDNHLFIGDCLLLKGSISKLRGKHRNAKYQFSLCLSIKIAKFGRYDHQDIIEVLLQAADNMRQVGYFNDALETTLLVETLISGRFGKSSIPAAWYMLLHANILCDRQKVSKAEELYCSAVEIVKRESLDNTYLHMQLIHGLARCYHSNNKISDADNLYLEAQQLCKTLFGSQCYAFFEIRCDHLFLKLNSKPFEQTKALTALKDEVLLFYVTEFGPLHPKTVHTKGRIGILTSRQKKDSGKKLISDCLRYFDENKQYPFCYDHPWVMELGGYTKKASKERLSSIVQENSIAGWSYPIFEGDTNFGYKVMPSTLLVDVKNYNPEVWGNVHYYGGDRLSYDSPIDPVKRISAFGVKYLKGSTNGQGTKEISTDAVEQGEKILSDAKQELIGDTTESVGTVEDDQRSISSLPIRHLQEMVEAEAQARLEVEKNYSREQKARQALEKQLEVELVTRKALDEDLLREKAERAVLEARLKDITSVAFDKVEEAKALSAAVAVIVSLSMFMLLFLFLLLCWQ